MNNTESVIINTDTNPEKSEKEKVKNIAKNQFGIFPKSLIYGVSAGILMGLYLLVLQMSGGSETVALKFFKYLFLLGILGYGLTEYRKWNISRTFFKNGITIGAYTSFFSGLSLVGFNLIVSIIAPGLSFEKFSLTVNSPGDFAVTNVAIFFEVLVFGMVCTFIFLQSLKGKGQGDITTNN